MIAARWHKELRSDSAKPELVVECETRGLASLKCGELVLVLRKVGWSVVYGEASKVGRCCIDRPRQSFDNGVMGVNRPAAGFRVANGAMVLL